MKKILKLIFGVNLLVAILSMLSYLSPFIDPINSWIFSALAIFNPFYIIVHFFFIVFWLFTKRKYALLSILVIALGWNHLTSIYGFNYGSEKKSEIEIFSYNVQNSSFVNYKNPIEKDIKTEQYLEFLKSNKPIDILCAYELSYRSTTLLKKAFNFSHSAEYEHKSIAIYSKYPVVQKGLIDFGNRSNNCLWADIALQNDTIRIYAVHFESSKVSKQAEKVIDSGDIQEKETWRSVKEIFSKYGKHAVNRSNQLKQLIAHKSNSPYPVIICGDFNETPQSHLYRVLSSDMQDSFKEMGQGYGATYAGPMPGLRIDYILADSNFEIREHQIIKEKYSDHYPIKSGLSLKNKD